MANEARMQKWLDIAERDIDVAVIVPHINDEDSLLYDDVMLTGLAV